MAFSKILIRATNWLGDAVMSLPAIRAVRAGFPRAEIVVLARPWVADLYEGERTIDRVIRYEPKPGFRDFRPNGALHGRSNGNTSIAPSCCRTHSRRR